MISLKSCAVIAAFLLCLVHASGQSAARQVKANLFSVIEQSFQKVVFTSSFGDYSFEKAETEKSAFVKMTAGGYNGSNRAGQPQLPVLSRIIEIPEGAIPEVRITSSGYHDVSLAEAGYPARIMPAQPPVPKVEGIKPVFAFDQKAYLVNEFTGLPLVNVTVEGKMRASRLASLVVAPVQYNPVTGMVRIFDTVTAEIIFRNADIAGTLKEKQRLQSPYFGPAVPKTVNYRSLEATPTLPAGHPVKYVIVSDPMFRDALQPFIQWKTKKGFQVLDAYTSDLAVGRTTTSIKAYLRQLYMQATAADPAPTFLLLVGDVAQVPSFSCGTHVSDMYYCEFTGDDLPDMYYGRFSAQNADQLQPLIDKTLQYEQFLMPDPSYLNEAVLIAGADATHQLIWGNGQMSYAAGNYINQDHGLLAYTYLQPEPAGAQYAKNIVSDINRGVAFANYTAHGNSSGWTNPAFTVTTINSLQNKDRYCLMIGNCCETSTFQKNSFGEEITRAAGKGAFGYIGASDLSYWDEDYWWAVGNGTITASPAYESTGPGAYDLTFHDHGEPREKWATTMGQMLFAGNMAVQESNSVMKKYYWEIYCLLGDPSVSVYFSVPTPLQVQYERIQPVTSRVINVKTEPYAYVAINKDNLLYGAAEADSEGIAEVAVLPFKSAGKAQIVVTAQNRRPYTDTLTLVSPAGPFVVMNRYTVNDVAGNENHLAEPGESLTMDMEMKNLGRTAAPNTLVRIATADPYVTVSDSVQWWPAIAAGDSMLMKSAFIIRIHNEIPDQHKVRFSITSESDTSHYTGYFSLLLYAPKLECSNIRLTEQDGGNGNGITEPSETAVVQLTLVNSGHALTDSIASHLIVPGGEKQYSSAVRKDPGLASGSSMEIHFPYYIDKNMPEGSLLKAFVPVTSDGYHTVISFSFVAGRQAEGFEKGSINLSKLSTKGSKSWVADTSSRYEGSYAARSGDIGNLDQSEMYVEAVFLSDQQISFYRKVSSENGYDFLKFIIDGNEVAAWSGSKDWLKVTFPVSAGYHKLSWSYIKDEATVAGMDAAWIDNIEFPPYSAVAGSSLDLQLVADPPVLCSGKPVQLYAIATGGDGSYQYEWAPEAQLSSASVFNPVLTAASGTVVSLTVTSGQLSESRSITIPEDGIPETPSVAIAGDHLLSSAPDGNQWYSSEGIIPGAVEQAFYPRSNGIYYVVFTSAGGCASAPSNQVSFLSTAMTGRSTSGVTVSPNPFGSGFTVHYSIAAARAISIALTDIAGRTVLKINNLPSGELSHEIKVPALPAGVYFCRIESEGFSQVLKLIKY